MARFTIPKRAMTAVALWGVIALQPLRWERRLVRRPDRVRPRQPV